MLATVVAIGITGPQAGMSRGTAAGQAVPQARATESAVLCGACDVADDGLQLKLSTSLADAR